MVAGGVRRRVTTKIRSMEEHRRRAIGEPYSSCCSLAPCLRRTRPERLTGSSSALKGRSAPAFLLRWPLPNSKPPWAGG